MAGRDAIIYINTENLSPPSPNAEKYAASSQASSRHTPGSPDTVCSPLIQPTRRPLSISEDEDDRLTPTGKALYRILENPIFRYCIYIIPVGALLAIPLALFATKHRHDVRPGGMPLVGLFAYIEIMWVSLWVSKLIAAALPTLFQGICGIISTGIRKYALVLRAVEIPMSIFIWTVMALCWFPIVHAFDDVKDVEWMTIFNKVIRASIASSAIVLGEKILMQLISVNYHSQQFRDKIKDIKATVRAIDLLYESSLRQIPDRSEETLDEDYDIHDTTNVQQMLKENAADRSTRRIFGGLHFFGQKLVSALGYMASDLTGSQILRPTATHAIVDAALERRAGAEALARRIFKCLVAEGRKAICPNVLAEVFGFGSEKEAAWIFAQLDRDGNGNVSMEEMVMLVTGISRQRKDIWKSACNIRDAIRTLDRVISVIVLAIVIMIYSSFFSNFVGENLKTIITLLSASAFSFGQTVGEFNAACIQVFIKHPFDVGDRINMKDQEYEVVRISLLYTVFRRIDTDAIVQVANSIVGTLFIENISRSRAMKERYQFSVDAATEFKALELLRAELEEFVRAPENSRDYQSDVDIQLLSVGDLKQLDLRVEIRHKSNWADDKLRTYRRSKFMCALVSAMRKVPIYGPDGGGPEQGTIDAPNYTVSIDRDAATAARAEFDLKQESKKIRRESSIPDLRGATTSGLEILPSLLRGFQYEQEGAISGTAAYLRHGRRHYRDNSSSRLSLRPSSRPVSWISR
jgi:small-conductance mechanosensitive channel